MTNEPKLWCDMTDAEKGALLLAHHNGEEIQFRDCDGGWIAENPNWVNDTVYRVKPALMLETVEHRCHLHERSDGSKVTISGHNSGPRRLSNITHTYTITDGRVTAYKTVIHD